MPTAFLLCVTVMLQVVVEEGLKFKVL